MENGAFIIVNVICPCDLGMFVFPASEKDQERTGKYIPHIDSKATRKLTLYIGVTLSISISLTLVTNLGKSYKCLGH